MVCTMHIKQVITLFSVNLHKFGNQYGCAAFLHDRFGGSLYYVRAPYRPMQTPEHNVATGTALGECEGERYKGDKHKAEAELFLPRRHLFHADEHAKDRLLTGGAGCKTGSPVKGITSLAQQIGVMFGAHVPAACKLLGQRTSQTYAAKVRK